LLLNLAMILIAVTGLAVAVAAVAAFLGEWSWRLDLIANFRPQLIVVATVLGLALLAGRWRKTAAVTLAGALINLVVVAPLYLPAPRPQEMSLRIMSFNVRADNTRFAELVDYIRKVDADLVVLHEASRRWELALASVSLDYEIRSSRDGASFGTLLLAPPQAQVESFGFDVGQPRAIEVTMPDGTAVLAIHPVSPVSARRARHRDDQLVFAAEWALRQSGPAIVVGDFNATPWSHAFRRLLASTNLVNSQRGFGVQASFSAYSSFLFRVPIDHLLHTPDLAVLDRSLGPPIGSDHYPLIVDLGKPLQTSS
jgi:endonuclease/exonuclease/phosphatase (EEP) superfamily protein YafD